MKLGPGEPAAGPWWVERLDAFARSLLEDGPSPRPRVVAVDGRGGAGKSTLAQRLRLAIPGSVVVHTDDVAWWHSRFGWADLMVDGILAPLHAGRDVRFQPPAWAPRGRGGHIEVPAGVPGVIVEGVGASRRDVTHLIDVAVWIQSDYEEAENGASAATSNATATTRRRRCASGGSGPTRRCRSCSTTGRGNERTTSWRERPHSRMTPAPTW